MKKIVAGAVIVAGLVALVVVELTDGWRTKAEAAEAVDMNELPVDYQVFRDARSASLRKGYNTAYSWGCKQRDSEECLDMFAFALDEERQYDCVRKVISQYGVTIPEGERGSKRSATIMSGLLGIDTSGVQVTDHSLPFKLKWGKGVDCS